MQEIFYIRKGHKHLPLLAEVAHRPLATSDSMAGRGNNLDAFLWRKWHN